MILSSFIFDGVLFREFDLQYIIITNISLGIGYIAEGAKVHLRYS